MPYGKAAEGSESGTSVGKCIGICSLALGGAMGAGTESVPASGSGGSEAPTAFDGGGAEDDSKRPRLFGASVAPQRE
eukprot:scaffold132316_cov27-Tisochrysis_lutea.AAC.9